MISFRPLTADEIECKVKKITSKGLVLLLYKTARTDMDMLDETVGPENWYNDYKEIKGNLYAGITINGVTKWDCGIESREDGEGNEKKGEASDAFKRAGFRWGIGRALYTSPFIWVPVRNCNLEDTGKTDKYGKPIFRCKDTFSVAHIEYDPDGKRITWLVVWNDNMGCEAFSWRAGSAPAKTTPKDPELICECCGKPIVGVKFQNGTTWSAVDVATKMAANVHKQICYACYKAGKGGNGE